jgi:hypothetical protein
VNASRSLRAASIDSMGLSASQRRALAAMEVPVYVRRQAPPAAARVGAWSAEDAQSALAFALARAGGSADVNAFCVAWAAYGQALPTLDRLRREAGAKRALWHLLRGRRRRS